ncbi:MAG: nucleotide exchange factor GrpE [Gammaproteobacteria bacterium]|nr:nucleotide exchange factor GrpE [Gammaproteobacteria bacterium]
MVAAQEGQGSTAEDEHEESIDASKQREDDMTTRNESLMNPQGSKEVLNDPAGISVTEDGSNADEQRINELTDSLLRARAETENVRRRGERDVANAHKYGLERFANQLLPVKDSLELGLAATDQVNATIDHAKEGMDLTLKMLTDVMAKAAIVELNPLGEKFNPEQHQAMQMQETDEAEPNTVIAVHQKGYTLNDRLMRPAMVIVAKAMAAKTPVEE